MRFNCSHCGKEAETTTSAFNRAKRAGLNLHCGRRCAGLARRKHKTDSQKVAEKREYDKQYRAKNQEMVKAKKHAWFKRSYDPEKARIHRKGRSAEHAEYCRRPEYKEWKREYDKQYRAKRDYGEFWECSLLVLDLSSEVRERASRYEIGMMNGTLSKTQKRKRDYERTYSAEPQVGPLGNA